MRPQVRRSTRSTTRATSGLLLMGLLLLGACGGSSEVVVNNSDDPEFDLSGDGGTTFLALAPSAPFVCAYRGVRLVKLYQVSPGVEYREDVGSDGQGNFAIDTLELLTPNPNPGVFLALQDLRETLSYRYRDFLIRDYPLFQQQYVVAIVDGDRSVAGVTTVQLIVQRALNPQGNYWVDFDPNTGLVLAYQEYDLNGGLLAEVTFESFAYDADVSDMELVSHLFATTQYSLGGGNLESAFGFAPLVPDYKPVGYRLEDTVEKQMTPDGERAKVFLTDGLEVLILTSQQPLALSGNVPASRIMSLELGSWAGLMGDIAGYPVLMAGKVSVQEQALVLQSAID
jgi:hypothetical protein